MGDEEVHFNLNQSLKQLDFEKDECNSCENEVPINSKLIYDCKIQNSMNENMMNFKYIEDLDVEHLNASLELKEIVLNPNENSAKKSSSSEEKVQEVEKSLEGLIMKELPKHLRYVFLGVERAQPVIIAADLTVEKEQKLIKIL